MSFVTAGQDAGWVAGVGGDQDVVRLWRLTPNGAATPVAELPDLVSMDSAALADQLAVAGLRCLEGNLDEPEGGCGASGAVVLLINATGEISTVSLFDDDISLDDGDGLTIAGSSGDSVWISTERGLFEVSANGAVVRTLPDATGGECVIDDSLYRIVGPEPGTDSTQGSPPPVTSVDPAPLTVERRPIEIQRLDDDTFTPVPGGRRELHGDAYANLNCTGRAVEAARSNGVLTDRWTPTAGWQAPRGVPAPGTAALSTAAGTFALGTDGTVLERGQDGAFTAAGIRLPNLSGSGEMPASLAADRSPSMVVACTTRSNARTDTVTVCRAAAAG